MPRANKKVDDAEVATEDTSVKEAAEVEVNETDVAIRAAFDENVNSEGGEEATKMAMLQAGCKIKAVSRLYNTFMIDSGQMASKEEKDTALDAALVDLDLTDEDVFNEAVTSLATSITGASEQSAATMVRAWAKRNDAECFVKPKGAPRTDSFTYKFNEAIIANPNMTEAECNDILKEGSGTDSAKSYFQNLRKLGNRIHAKYTNSAEVAEAA